MYQILDQSEGNVIAVRVSGKLERDSYKELLNQLDKRISEQRPVRIIYEITDFKGWEPGAAWEDIKFDIRHNKNIERAAIVGDTPWTKLLTALMRPFALGEMAYFDISQEEDAWRWIREDVSSETTNKRLQKRWHELNRQQKAGIVAAAIVQLGLLSAALVDIHKRPARQIRGSKLLWRGLVFINFFGPLAYFIFGRKR